MTRVVKPAAGGKGALIAIYCSSKNVSENGTELPSATTTLLMMEPLSQTSMEQIFQMALTLQYTGTGDDIVDSCVDVYNLSSCRFLQQWMVFWEGYDGNIYVTTAKTLPNFEAPRIFIAKETENQKHRYPSVIHKWMGEIILIFFPNFTITFIQVIESEMKFSTSTGEIFQINKVVQDISER